RPRTQPPHRRQGGVTKEIIRQFHLRPAAKPPDHQLIVLRRRVGSRVGGRARGCQTRHCRRRKRRSHEFASFHVRSYLQFRGGFPQPSAISSQPSAISNEHCSC